LADEWKNTPVLNPAFIIKDGLTNACMDHVKDKGPKGTTGNTGSDGSTPAQRVDKYALANLVG
jgi:uncharacterized protein YkwD